MNKNNKDELNLKNLNEIKLYSRRLLVLFLGAGFDRHFGFPSFKELLNIIFNQLDSFARKYLIKPSNFLKIIKKIHKNYDWENKQEFKLDIYIKAILKEHNSNNIN